MAREYSLLKTQPNEMLRKKYACDDDWIEQFLLRETIGHVATRWDTQPFITPVLFWYNPKKHEIIFHTNLVGRLRANIEAFPEACFEACKGGKLLPSNVALEFAYQYESVVAFGLIHLIDEPQAKGAALYGLIAKYFPGMTAGQEYRPIDYVELARTAVYALSIQSWSGKRNWKARADQSEEWAPLDERWLKETE